MSTIRNDLVYAAHNRAIALVDYNIYDNVDKRHEFIKKTILADKSLTRDDTLKIIKILNEDYDYNKILFNEGKRRNSEWIPYNNLQNIKYLTKGGCSEIYTADWIDGNYNEWNSEENQLNRFGTRKVILKKLKNVERANRSWFDEVKSHLTIANKWTEIVQCFGLTQDLLEGSYMLVIRELDTNLKDYLQQYQSKFTWKERLEIILDIGKSLSRIHNEKAIHRDLHSGNILYNQYKDKWFISDLGFCGPADKPLKSIYGNLPYIAPEVIVGKEYTFASDIYSIAMLMWEISSGQRPFINYEDKYDLAMDIVNGMRPEIISGTPSKYKKLMEQCWDADPTKRPDIFTINDKIREINKLY
ncbi:hypothetical protein RclHR1_05550012 [Rhizophagus clarus]|uniref:Protein kinase domain-containing protein n=1 Tax=Rhizophagus clarus TaxID=94130 RepID=A0A2Z6S0B9_9GLOM|nr:hypothetical protein RclHR1_05550012 [Rhizophagus clarus]